MEVEVFGNFYRIGKLDALKQFHVARRVAPIVAALGLSVSELITAGKSLKVDADLITAAGPVLDILSKMKDEEVEYIIRLSLAVVQRKVETPTSLNWVNVQTGQQLQFQDITMPMMVRLVVEVLRENLGNFFPTPTAEAQSSPAS